MIPESYRAIELREYTEDLPSFQVVQKKRPELAKGEVLIKMAASPINPSDLSFLRGQYGIKKKLPCVPGFEGSGTVVASGGGFYANYLKGKNVACSASPAGEGTWAEYMKVPAQLCLPLKKSIELEQGSMTIVNPLTAWSLIEIARDLGAKAIMQTAAAGALGQMIHRLAKKKGLDVIDIVRREDQKQALESQGFENVLISEDTKFERELRVRAGKLNATVALDAVGGEMTGTLAACMPNQSHVIVYGGLAGEACSVHPGSLIFQGQTVHGYWLSTYLSQRNPLQLVRLSGRVQKLLNTELKSQIRGRYSLEEGEKAVKDYTATMSGGKILITP